MSHKTIFEFEQDYDALFINGIIDSLCGSEGEENVFNTLYDRGLGEVMDIILVSRHGRRVLDPYQLQLVGQDYPLAYWTVKSYLIERERYFMQQMQYFDSEYNPIENYASEEHEVTELDIKQRHSMTVDLEKPYSRTHTRQNPQVITEQYTEADVVSEATQLKSTTTNSVSPYDSSGFSNKEKTETEPGKITNTEKPYNRKFKTPQNTVTDTESLAANKEVSREYTDDAHKDKHTRDLSRSGNIGIQTAAQMMAYDESFHWKNRWMSKICLDIVNLITKGVWSI